MNNSKLNNSTSAQPTIQNSKIKIQHCAKRNNSKFKNQNSKLVNVA